MFIRRLEESKYQRLPAGIRDWYEKESNGWFGLGTKEQKREKLNRLALFLYQLIVLFEKDKEVHSSEEYGLLVKLFGEHCELKKGGSKPKKKTGVEQPSDEEADSTGSDNDSDDDAAGSNGKALLNRDSENEASEEPQKEELEIHIKKNTSGDTLQSPHDPDATYGHKGVGYSAQIAETCNNEDKPEIITACEVHGAARSDLGKVPDVLTQLKNTARKPEVLFADGGYPSVPSTPLILEHGVELVAPVNRGPLDISVMGRDLFAFDEDGRVIQCPAGYSPIDHRVLSNGTDRTLHAVFKGDTCRSCEMLDRCPVRAPNHRKRGCSPRQTKGNFRLEVTLELRLRDENLAQQQTPEWKERYKIRAGVEATMSELKGCHGLGKLRVRRLPRVCFAVLCKVTACNIRRWARAQTASDGSSPFTSDPMEWVKHAFFELGQLVRLNGAQSTIYYMYSL